MINIFQEKTLKTKKYPQPDPSVQPKARGLLHMECEYIAHHNRRRDSRLEHLIASFQPKKHSEDYPKHSMDSRPEQWVPEVLKSTR